MKTIHTLQAYRGLAALLVVFSHAQNIYAKYGPSPGWPVLFQFGSAGVQFFFVLSGFIMLWVHAADIGRPAAAGKYFHKRFIRIYPIYWVATLILLPFWIEVPAFGL